MTRLIALGPSLLFAIAFTNNMDTFSQLLNVQQSVQLPLAIIPLISFNCNPRIMGKFLLAGWKEIVMWCLSGLIVLINIYMIYSSLSNFFEPSTGLYFGVATFMIIYISILAWVIYEGRIRLFWEKVNPLSPRHTRPESISYPNAWSTETHSWSVSPTALPGVSKSEQKMYYSCQISERTPLLCKSIPM